MAAGPWRLALSALLLARQAAAILRHLPVEDHGKDGAVGKDPPALEALVSDLWDGMDIADAADVLRILDGTATALARPRRPLRRDREAGNTDGSKRSLVLLGPFDVGTHLLLNTLRLNHETEVFKACSWESMTIDNDKTAHCRLWKHGVNISDGVNTTGGEPVYTILNRQGVALDDAVIVMLVRSPLATMVAWKKAGYDLKQCLARDMASFGSPCWAMHMTWRGNGQPDPWKMTSFSSTMDAYNRYMRMYKAIRADQRVHRAVLVTYEDLVFSPGDVVNEIADAMGWPEKEQVAIVEGPAKNHGGAVGRERALQKLRGRMWLQEIQSEENRRIICRGLDAGALEGIQDNTLSADEPSDSYMADCEGYS